MSLFTVVSPTNDTIVYVDKLETGVYVKDMKTGTIHKYVVNSYDYWGCYSGYQQPIYTKDGSKIVGLAYNKIYMISLTDWSFHILYINDKLNGLSLENDLVTVSLQTS
jgi:hypothetical protein